jgi:hypothetical protein
MGVPSSRRFRSLLEAKSERGRRQKTRLEQVRHDDNAVRFRDGTVMPISDGTGNKAFPELLRNASILDQFRIPYPRGPLEKPPPINSDPGRFRNTAFFKKMYGDCRRGEVEPRLVSLRWLPKNLGQVNPHHRRQRCE